MKVKEVLSRMEDAQKMMCRNSTVDNNMGKSISNRARDVVVLKQRE